MSTSPWARHRVSILVAVVWTLLVVGALVATLQSLRTEDLDGLNNLTQIPFALPWSLIVPVYSPASDAWVLAAFGLVNGTLISVLIGRWEDRRSE